MITPLTPEEEKRIIPHPYLKGIWILPGKED